jgi:hypothetical protein
MDSLDLFPCTDSGLLPFLLLDGHGTQFPLPFMRYILDVQHRWKVCIGVPNGTAQWQVRDSAKQNGGWKMMTTCDKRKLSQFQFLVGMPVYIRPSDTVPMVNNAWKQLFAREQPNKHVISRHGWQPLNRGLLKIPEILKTKVASRETTTTTATPPQEILPTITITLPVPHHQQRQTTVVSL